MASGIQPEKCRLDLKMKNLKPLVANWMYESHSLCAKDKKNVIMGWEKPGLLNAWKSETQNSALKEYYRGNLFNKNSIHSITINEEETLPELEFYNEVLDKQHDENACANEEDFTDIEYLDSDLEDFMYINEEFDDNEEIVLNSIDDYYEFEQD